MNCCTTAASSSWAPSCLISRGIKTDYWPLFWSGHSRTGLISCNARSLWFAADDLIRRAAGRAPHLLLSLPLGRSDPPPPHFLSKHQSVEERERDWERLSEWGRKPEDIYLLNASETGAAFLFTHQPVVLAHSSGVKGQKMTDRQPCAGNSPTCLVWFQQKDRGNGKLLNITKDFSHCQLGSKKKGPVKLKTVQWSGVE